MPRGRHRAAARDARPAGGDAADDRGLLQRRGPAQAPARRGDDRVAAGRRQPRALGRGSRERGRLHRRDRHAAASSRCRSSGRSTSSACGARRRSSRRPIAQPARRTRRSASRSTQVARFAQLAADNLDVSKPILGHDRRAGARSSRPSSSGADVPLDAFVVAVAVTVSLMFVTLLLAAGMLALEREEHAFGRLVRGLVSRTALLVEKIAAGGAVLVRASCLLMLVGLAALARPRLGARAAVARSRSPPARSRSPRWAWRSAASRARSAPPRCWPSLLSLPIAFLALVPAGAVADAVRRDRGGLPVLPVQARAARRSTRRSTAAASLAPLAHLLALTLAFAALARLALRRFALTP